MSETLRTASSRIDLAILGAASARPMSASALASEARAALRPDMTPTLEVLEARIEAASRAGELGASDLGLQITEAGRTRLRALLLAPIADAPHGDAELCETLKLAFLDGLEERDRARLSADLLDARRRCIARQRTALAACEARRPAAARCRRRRLAIAVAALDDLAKTLNAEARHETA